jgi:signal transduction histidine kinase
VTKPKPRPPLLGRISPGAWTALVWCAAGAFALMIFRKVPDRQPTADALHLGRATWALLAVVMALPVALTRRRPLAVLGLILAESMASAALGPHPWMLFLLVANALVLYLAATFPRRTTAMAAIFTAAVQITGWRIMNGAWNPGLQNAAVPIISATVIAWMAGNSIRQRREYAEALRAQAATQAVQAERLRIARELHDMVAHSIGVIAIQAGAASMVLETQPAGARKALSAIELASRETLAGLRRMLGALRQAEDLPAQGLENIGWLAATTTDAGVRVEVLWRGRRRPLPPEIDLSAFRIIQESVTNVVRHANARRCQVSVDYREEELAIEVVDDGKGFAGGDTTWGTGHGISGMRERVGLLNGQFSAGPRAEGGFRVEARLPA